MRRRLVDRFRHCEAPQGPKQSPSHPREIASGASPPRNDGGGSPEPNRRSVRIALAQIKVTVGALKENAARIGEWISRAREQGADGVVFPELAVTGYPPEDLLFKPDFVRENLACVDRLARVSRGISAIVGFVDRDRQGRLYNAAAVLADGKRRAVYRKICLPNYGVFDEKRYFAPGEAPLSLDLAGVRVGLSICEDIWVEDGPHRKEAAAGARVLVNLSASPYHAGKRKLRESLLIRRARGGRRWVLYVNLVGGQDELVFDGGSLAVSPSGRIAFRAPQFEEGLFFVEIPLREGDGGARAPVSRSSPSLAPDQEILQALILGLGDYVRKNRFSRVVVGLSGGIDSALTAAVAAAALGAKAVTGVSMPSRYSSAPTQADARRVAENLGIGFLEIPIEPTFQTALGCLEGALGQGLSGVTAENLQARIRGLLLMALSNRFGWLVLATGNKSELSTGYCTLYGDLVGGFAVIKDVPKTWVYRLARAVNRHFGRPVIPGSVFTRPPSAELKPNQKDQDVLPPYGRLDRIIQAYVEQRHPARRIRRELRLDPKTLARVIRMIDSNEYKRRQAPVGIKITPLAFGRDRRMPITNRYAEAVG